MVADFHVLRYVEPDGTAPWNRPVIQVDVAWCPYPVVTMSLGAH